MKNYFLASAFTLLITAPRAAATCSPDWASDQRLAAEALRSVYMLGLSYSGGTAYVVDERGFLLTNDHVLSRAKRLPGEPSVPLVTEHCQGLEACRDLDLSLEGDYSESRQRGLVEVVARSPELDLAVVRLHALGRFPVLPWSRTGGEGGVMAVRAHSDAWGTLSTGRTLGGIGVPELKRRTPGHEAMDDGATVWVTDAEVRPGHSGSPLLDRCDGGAVGTIFGAKGRESSEGEAYFTSVEQARAFLQASAALMDEAERRVTAPGYIEAVRARVIAVKKSLTPQP